MHRIMQATSPGRGATLGKRLPLWGRAVASVDAASTKYLSIQIFLPPALPTVWHDWHELPFTSRSLVNMSQEPGSCRFAEQMLSKFPLLTPFPDSPKNRGEKYNIL